MRGESQYQAAKPIAQIAHKAAAAKSTRLRCNRRHDLTVMLSFCMTFIFEILSSILRCGHNRELLVQPLGLITRSFTPGQAPSEPICLRSCLAAGHLQCNLKSGVTAREAFFGLNLFAPLADESIR